MTTYHIDSCNGIECPSVNVVLMLIEKHDWNLRISGESWKKISHLKQNVVRKYQSEKVWNLSDILFKLSSFSFLSGYNGNITSQSGSTWLKSLSKSCFSSLYYSHFWYMFFKKRVQISHMSAITISISDNNSKKMDESWTRPTF